MIQVFCDGALDERYKSISDKAGIGIVILQNNKPFFKRGRLINIKDENSKNSSVVEWRAISYALRILNTQKTEFGYNETVMIYSDSATTLEKVKNNKFPKTINDSLIGQFKKDMKELKKKHISMFFQWIPREENKEANLLAQRVLVDHFTNIEDITKFLMKDLKEVIDKNKDRIERNQLFEDNNNNKANKVIHDLEKLYAELKEHHDTKIEKSKNKDIQKNL